MFTKSELELLLEAFTSWMDTGRNDEWNEDGTATNPEYQTIITKLAQAIAVGD